MEVNTSWSLRLAASGLYFRYAHRLPLAPRRFMRRLHTRHHQYFQIQGRRSLLSCCVATVHDYPSPCHPLGIIARQKHRNRSNTTWFSKSSERMQTFRPFFYGWIGKNFSRKRRFHVWIDCISEPYTCLVRVHSHPGQMALT